MVTNMLIVKLNVKYMFMRNFQHCPFRDNHGIGRKAISSLNVMTKIYTCLPTTSTQLPCMH
uniref:Uncharacterized protein n=1 Tax=Ciona intestinalis TaxID=7719 RepID=H2XRY5_CIOIN